jgi:hypothetical protein
MTQPEKQTKKATQNQRASKEQSGLRNSDQSDENNAEDNDQTDRVPGQATSAVTSERNNLGWVRFGVVRDSSPTVTNLGALRNHKFSLGWSARCSKTAPDLCSLTHAPRMDARSTGGASFVPPPPGFL